MVTVPLASQDTLRSVRRIQAITITWMTVEAALSLYSAAQARSPALAAFGGDSVIELISAFVVLWRFRHPVPDRAERFAARLTSGLLFALAAFVIATSILSLLGYNEPRPSYLGMAVLAAAALLMPWLAKEKRRLSALTASAALRADAAESALCAYLSLLALAGLAARALLHIGWADPLAALAITPLILREARQSWRGKPCSCC
jgi:divalent metal cation (Fe/Co/Zn/Cd) transporter